MDVIFLDIQMPELNGLDFIKTLGHRPKIVTISAHRHFALESFELDVVDYLLKPFSFPRLLKAIEKVRRQLPSSLSREEGLTAETQEVEEKPDHIFIKADKKLVKIQLSSILFIESLKDYVRIRTLEEDYITYCTLNHITNQLNPSSFMRTHRSYTIALDKVEQLEGNHVLIQGHYVPVSRNRKQEVIKKLVRTS